MSKRIKDREEHYTLRREQEVEDMFDAPTNHEECTCKSAFGQLLWDEECPAHTRCTWTMPGVPIRCILTSDHKGNHK